MKINSHLSQRLDQRMALLPQMLHSIEILQLSTADLVDRIEQELASNEVLELGADESASESTDGADTEDFDPDQYSGRVDGAASDAKHAMIESLPSRDPGLREHLRVQLYWRALEFDLRERVELAIDALDDRGLLPLDDAELAVLVGDDHVESVLEVLRGLEPRGVGARSAIEAMLLQVSKNDPEYGLIESLLNEHLEALSRNRIPDVARALGISIDDLTDLLDRIRLLEPCPGAVFGVQGVAQIQPDLIVERLPDDDFRVVVDDFSLPILSINDDYARLAKSAAEKPMRDYLREKLRDARDLMTAVQQRKETLARVGAAVMSRQRGFLRDGRAGICPLRMTEIADELDLHNSTISRAIAGKYVQTDHGVFALRAFFDGSRLAKPTGAAPAKGRIAILHEIQRLIAEEDPRKPRSDDDLVDSLAAVGVEVARRTVAKYRKELGIGSSWQRRRHGSR